MEHISRGTIGAPDLLVIVTDPGARSVRTVARIREIAGSLGLSDVPVLTVINRVKAGKKPDISGIPGLHVWIPEDPKIEDADRSGEAIVNVPEDSPAKMAVRKLVEKLAGFRRECSRPKVICSVFPVARSGTTPSPTGRLKTYQEAPEAT